MQKPSFNFRLNIAWFTKQNKTKQKPNMFTLYFLSQKKEMGKKKTQQTTELLACVFVLYRTWRQILQ